MKDILRDYYQIIIDDKSIRDKKYFSYNNHLFYLYKYERNIEEIDSLMTLSNFMLQNNIRINQVVNNIYNNPLTYHDNNYYTLIKVDYRFSDNLEVWGYGNKGGYAYVYDGYIQSLFLELDNLILIL